MGGLKRIAEKHNLKIIEDCAQALGSSIKKKYCGTWGNAGAFSFCYTKTLTLEGEGGMILCHDKEYAEHLAALRNVGYSHHYVNNMWKPAKKGEYIGFNMRLLELQSAIGLHKLKEIDKEFNRRKNLVFKLKEGLKDNEYFSFFPLKDYEEPVYYQFPVKFDTRKSSLKISELVKTLRKKNLPADTAYATPINRYPFFKKYVKENNLPEEWLKEKFPNYEKLVNSMFILKLGAKTNDQTINDFIKFSRNLR
jgi:dTDP-4-amino-4,6-dideoxygalactose transaminase